MVQSIFNLFLLQNVFESQCRILSPISTNQIEPRCSTPSNCQAVDRWLRSQDFAKSTSHAQRRRRRTAQQQSVWRERQLQTLPRWATCRQQPPRVKAEQCSSQRPWEFCASLSGRWLVSPLWLETRSCWKQPANCQAESPSRIISCLTWPLQRSSTSSSSNSRLSPMNCGGGPLMNSLAKSPFPSRFFRFSWSLTRWQPFHWTASPSSF